MIEYKGPEPISNMESNILHDAIQQEPKCVKFNHISFCCKTIEDADGRIFVAVPQASKKE